MTRYRIIKTFAGPLALIERPSGDLETTWVNISGTRRLRGAEPHPRLQPALVRKLERYFAGRPVDFDEVPLPPGPPFYRACWRACRAIPRGETRTYGELAAAAGSPRAGRAAGQAMRRNPLCVIVPCHRVVASDGRLHGYAGAQEPGCPPLDVKESLLRLEGALPMYHAAALRL